MESHELKKSRISCLCLEGFVQHTLPLILEDTYHFSMKASLKSYILTTCTCWRNTRGDWTTTRALNFVLHIWQHGIGSTQPQTVIFLWRYSPPKLTITFCSLVSTFCSLISTFCIQATRFAFSIVLSRLLLSKTHFVLAVLHSLHTAFCFDTFHCDDVTFFVTLRTQNLHDNLFPAKIYNYFSNMADLDSDREYFLDLLRTSILNCINDLDGNPVDSLYHTVLRFPELFEVDESGLT